MSKCNLRPLFKRSHLEDSKVELTHSLKHEHRIIEQALRALDGICLRLVHGESVPGEALAAVCDFISTFAESYHRGKEETFLLPALEELGLLQDTTSVDRAVHEHAVEVEIVHDLRTAIESYTRGDRSSTQKLIESGRQYSDLMVGHFQKEDGVLFRIVEDVLDEATKERLAASMKGAELRLGSNGVKKYERIAETLEKEWAV